ncbi:MAG: hypothetical protein KDH94_05030 [Coxiellaceae bacterium]|nr:hypothetical protein [Coxiellaceae bacterium]
MSRRELQSLFKSELEYYRRIDNELAIYTDNPSNEQAAHIMSLYAETNDILEQQAPTFITYLQSKDFQDKHLICHTFLSNILRFKDLDAIDALQFKLAIHKISLSEPGKNLLKQLNIALQKKEKTIDVYATNANSMSTKEYRINYPKNFHLRNQLNITVGKKNTLITTILFISVAHELIHVLHHELGVDKKKSPLPFSLQDPTRCLYSGGYYLPLVDEYRTIESDDPSYGGLCENTFRGFYKLSLRGGWMGAALSVELNEDVKNLLWFVYKKQKSEIIDCRTIAIIGALGMKGGQPHPEKKLTESQEPRSGYCTIS